MVTTNAQHICAAFVYIICTHLSFLSAQLEPSIYVDGRNNSWQTTKFVFRCTTNDDSYIVLNMTEFNTGSAVHKQGSIFGIWLRVMVDLSDSCGDNREKTVLYVEDVENHVFLELLVTPENDKIHVAIKFGCTGTTSPVTVTCGDDSIATSSQSWMTIHINQLQGESNLAKSIICYQNGIAGLAESIDNACSKLTSKAVIYFAAKPKSSDSSPEYRNFNGQIIDFNWHYAPTSPSIINCHVNQCVRTCGNILGCHSLAHLLSLQEFVQVGDKVVNDTYNNFTLSKDICGPRTGGYSHCSDVDWVTQCPENTQCFHTCPIRGGGGGTAGGDDAGWGCTCDGDGRAGYITVTVVGNTFDKPRWQECVDLNECAASAGYKWPDLKGDPTRPISHYRKWLLDAGVCVAAVEDSICVNDDGSFHCECGPGYSGNYLDKCSDVVECNDPDVRAWDGACPEPNGCVNYVGSYKCECVLGFRAQIRGGVVTCEDVNECDEKRCAWRCVNKPPGSYTCKCPEGEVLGLDNLTCHRLSDCDIARQSGELDIPNCQQVCSKDGEGIFRCSCFAGYTTDVLDERLCRDTDECSEAREFGHCVRQCLHWLNTSDLHQLYNKEVANSFPCCKNTAGDFLCSCVSFEDARLDAMCDVRDECADVGERYEGYECVDGLRECECERCQPGYDMDDDGGGCVERSLVLVSWGFEWWWWLVLSILVAQCLGVLIAISIFWRVNRGKLFLKRYCHHHHHEAINKSMAPSPDEKQTGEKSETRETSERRGILRDRGQVGHVSEPVIIYTTTRQHVEKDRRATDPGSGGRGVTSPGVGRGEGERDPGVGRGEDSVASTGDRKELIGKTDVDEASAGK